MGAGPAGRRDIVPVEDRRTVSEELSNHCQDDIKATVPRVCTYLSPTLPRGGTAGRRGPSEHIVQAFHLLRAGV